MKVFKRDLTHESGPIPGTWRAQLRNGIKIARFTCPLCGFSAGLGHGSNHDIDERGKVHPSVVCDGRDCSFHEWVQLDGWEDYIRTSL